MSGEAFDWIVRKLRGKTGTYARSSNGSWSYKNDDGDWRASRITDQIVDDLVTLGDLTDEAVPVVPGANRDLPTNGEDAW